MGRNSTGLQFGPISAAAPGPLYEQVVAAVKREVAAGRLKPGDPLPSLRTLAADLLVSLITVKRAYEDLERDGVIYSRQGLGAFVADGGGARVRREQRGQAQQALRAAAGAGQAAGLTEEDLIAMLKAEIIGAKKT
jgi:GntR family transcriptional regulator